MKRIHIVGHKNSGKTTLIVQLVGELARKGYRVGTIKHTHHHHELDIPGKDSYRHREAGAESVGVISQRMNAIFWPQSKGRDKSDTYQQFERMMNQCDIVLVEGDSQADVPKIEVFRTDTGQEPKALSDSTIRALVTDDEVAIEIPVWNRSDLKMIVENIECLT